MTSRIFLFFFSSRRRHTRFKCDWSSDVCSSDLRTHVEIELGPDLFQVEAADPGDTFQARDELERHRYPRAPFVLAKNELAVLDRESRDRLGRVAVNSERNGQFGVFLAKRIDGSVELRFNTVTRNLHRVDSATIHRLQGENRVVRVEGECTIPTEQIWCAQTR